MGKCPECGWDSPHGVEVRGVYDGSLYWVCPVCLWAWERFAHGHLGTLSRAYAEKHNRE